MNLLGTENGYVPNIDVGANLDTTPEILSFRYAKIGEMAIISGRFSADPTTGGGTPTDFLMSVPDVSEFVAQPDLSGTAVAGGGPDCAELRAEVGTNKARVRWVANDTNIRNWSFIAMFTIPD